MPVTEPSASLSMDALMPAEMASKAEAAGVAKAKLALVPMMALAVLAGAFIALGAVFATVVATGGGELSYGLSKLLTGTVFCLGLVLVIVAGAELFTGNNLIVMAFASGRITARAVIRNWVIVYVGNFIGAVSVAVLVFASGQFEFAGGEVGATALRIAKAKLEFGFGQAVALGILCNALVCLAVWLCLSARTTTDKILAIIFPIAAFVAAGFEHCVANMYFVPYALLVKAGAPAGFWQGLEVAPDSLSNLTWTNFAWSNLLPVTIGNIIGGAILVGAVYWFIYLRGRDRGAAA